MSAVGPVRFDSLHLPLSRSSLIEASAGTGKTFAIAQLYLRLILGHGSQNAFTRPLDPGEILVVTFTEAATRELRHRIRLRLVQAAEVFSSMGGSSSTELTPDPLLANLVREYPAEQYAAISNRLEQAAAALDQAAISTIHGWCARMLREHAFDSGSPFELELEGASGIALRRAARDYWRAHVQTLDPAAAAVVQRHWKSPDSLCKALVSLIAWTESLEDVDPPAKVLANKVARNEALRYSWRQWADEFEQLIAKARALKQLKSRALNPHSVASRLRALRDWANGAPRSIDIGALLEPTLLPPKVMQAWLTGPPDHPSILSLDELVQLDVELKADCRRLYGHAARWCADQMQAERVAAGRLGFHDLLTRLDRALKGNGGKRLADSIRAQFPVALIDEFQDTDPLQFRMLQAIYPLDRSEDGPVLLMVGDPKQAIYGFRGADIQTYLGARQLTMGRHATLDTNHRSSAPLVRAVNRLFCGAEAKSPQKGVFLMGGGSGGYAMPFAAVGAAGRDEEWIVRGETAPVVTLWRDEANSKDAKGATEQRHAKACAGLIVDILEGAKAGTGFRERRGGFLPARSSDIAVLVNTSHEAQLIRRELLSKGVRSVFLSERESVFESQVAADVQRWLEACADPSDDNCLRAALGSATLGLDFESFYRQLQDETLWEARIEQFLRFREVWRRQGVLPMLTMLIHDFGVARTLLASGRERDLTDLLHLAEWLQEASSRTDGEQALIRYFESQRQSDENAQDNPPLRLRLESDADLVKVVTVHKSKGLEYPLVFIPFAWSAHRIDDKDCPVRWHDDQGRLRVDTCATPDAALRADSERLAEDVRKLYVALTRARHAVWLAVPALSVLRGSALGHVLIGEATATEDALDLAINELASGAADEIAAIPFPESTSRYAEPRPVTSWRPDPPLPAQSRRPWWIASFTRLTLRLDLGSSLTQGTAEAPVTPALVDATRSRLSLAETSESQAGTALDDIYTQCADDEQQSARTPDSVIATAAQESSASGLSGDTNAGLDGFPRGAKAGSFLHGLLEWMGAQGFGRCAARPEDLDDLIARRCNLAGLERWIPALQAWLRAWLDRPIPLDSLAPGLAPLVPSKLTVAQVELEFWLPLEGLDTRELDRAVRRYTAGGASRPALSAREVSGMLRGFIDLSFEHDGRFFVLDYKSNHLGASASDYHSARLRDSVLEHRYELQSVLYLFALHRLLRSRLGPLYDYERHIGGALVLFLRGHDGPAAGIYGERPPRALMNELDLLFAGGSASQSNAAAKAEQP